MTAALLVKKWANDGYLTMKDQAMLVTMMKDLAAFAEECFAQGRKRTEKDRSDG